MVHVSHRRNAQGQLQFVLSVLGDPKYNDDSDYDYDYVANNESDDSTNQTHGPVLLDIASLLLAKPRVVKNKKRNRCKKTPATVSLTSASLAVENPEVSVAEPSIIGGIPGTMTADRSAFLKAGVYHSGLGPSPKGTLIIKANKARAVAVILFTSDSIQVVSIAGCGTSVDLDKLEGEVRMRLSMPKVGTKLQRYREICDQMTALEPVWTQLLQDIAIPDEAAAADRSALLRQAFDRIGKPAGSAVELYHVFVSWAESKEPTGRCVMEEEAKHEHSQVGTHANCLICFDRLHEDRDISHLQACGHCVCADCLTAYIRFVAESGQSATIYCPAQKCEESIGLFDAAHILFGSDASLPEKDADSIFQRLVSNELEVFCSQQNGGRYCPAPNCGRLLKRASCGRNVMLCSCGASLCADCPNGSKSHSL